MSNEDYDDLDDIISELEDSLGVDHSDYLEEDDDFDSFDLDEDEGIYGVDDVYDELEDEDFDDEDSESAYEKSYEWREDV